MSRTLVLLRHAKAEPEGDLGDALRPLAAKGRKQAGKLGPRLAEVTGAVDLALVSSALRTTETFKLVSQHLSVREQQVSEELYRASPRQLLSMLQAVDADAATVLVVGHEPTMSGLAYLLHDTRDDLAQQVSLGIPTAAACVIDVPTPWAELDRSTAHLAQLVRPQD
ncbi:histidine phosphatase family protein [Georgenia sp. EYE_87]|uniref:SixA phosphatase family protein n=1 Tax=Georgenia sp. EYE_87 TaxID=2853448 RepID=UPI002002C2DF|nr:histidine phosphatase family protein [Georgenia sp. EYE_87]MCK6212176.1 histidine phosphatase family protein [Georgenia sp. EYE_87]